MKLKGLENGWTGGQFSLFQMLFGLYLLLYFLSFIGAGSFLHQALALSAVFSAIFLMVGFKEKFAILWILVTLYLLFEFERGAISHAPLYIKDKFYLGLLSFWLLYIPSAPYGSLTAKGRADLSRDWEVPPKIFQAAWIGMLALYGFFFLTTLITPHGINQSDVSYYGMPLFQLSFLVLAVIKKTRPLAWIMMLIGLGLLLTLQFENVIIAIIFCHLFLFDPAWIKANPKAQKMTLFYDGECGFCHTIVRFLLAEDKQNIFSFAPLQGSHLKTFFTEAEIASLPDSIVLRMNDGSTYLKSSAVAQMLMAMQGLWRPIGFLLWCVPVVLRDLVYDGVGKVRKRLAPTPQGLCPILIPEFRARFTE